MPLFKYFMSYEQLKLAPTPTHWKTSKSGRAYLWCQCRYSAVEMIHFLWEEGGSKLRKWKKWLGFHFRNGLHWSRSRSSHLHFWSNMVPLFTHCICTML